MELFFEVKPESKLYKDCFAYVEDYYKVKDIFKKICEEFGIKTTAFYPRRDRFHIDPTPEDSLNFSNQTMASNKGLFKKNSPQNKRWLELTKEIRFFTKPQLFYYMDIDGNWKERLFNDGEKLYASVSTNNDRQIKVPDFAIVMSGSDFYKIMEGLKED